MCFSPCFIGILASSLPIDFIVVMVLLLMIGCFMVMHGSPLVE